MGEKYFDYKPYSSSNKVNHLGYLKLGINNYSGKTFIRFKDQNEIDDFRTGDASGLLSFNEISGNNFYFQILNYDNFNYENYIYPDLSFSFRNKLNETVSTSIKDKCNANYSKYVQGFSRRHINNYTDNFKFTTLGTLGFDFDDIYDISNTNEVIPKKFNFNKITYFGLKEYGGYLSSKYIYSQFSDSCFYIRINDFIGNRGEQILIQNDNQTQITDNILAVIPIDSQPFSINLTNSQQDYSIKRNYFGGVKISKLQIQILDKYGSIVDLDDYPTNFIFEFTQEYSSERLSNFRSRM